MFAPGKLFNKANSHLRPRQYGPPYNHNPSSSKLPAASFSNLPIRPLPHKFKGGWVGIILLLQWVATLSTSWKWLIPTAVISHFYNTKHCLFQIPPPSLLSGLRGKPFNCCLHWTPPPTLQKGLSRHQSLRTSFPESTPSKSQFFLKCSHIFFGWFGQKVSTFSEVYLTIVLPFFTASKREGVQKKTGT